MYVCNSVLAPPWAGALAPTRRAWFFKLVQHWKVAEDRARSCFGQREGTQSIADWPISKDAISKSATRRPLLGNCAGAYPRHTLDVQDLMAGERLLRGGCPGMTPGTTTPLQLIGCPHPDEEHGPIMLQHVDGGCSRSIWEEHLLTCLWCRSVHDH